MPPIPQQPNPAPVQSPAPTPIVVKSGHSVWFYVLMTILSIIGIVIVLGIGVFIYREIQLQQAEQQLHQAAEQAVAQTQPIINALPGSGATDTGQTGSVQSGSQTVPQNASSYGTPEGTITVSGAASIPSVEVYDTEPPYDAQQMNSDLWTGSNTTTNTFAVVNGAWTASLKGVSKGDSLILVYDPSTHLLLAQGTVTVTIAPLWGSPSATINQTQLSLSAPTITGTASNISAVSIYFDGVYQESPVVNGKWSYTFQSTTLTPGTHPIVVYDQSQTNILAKATLTTGQ